MAKGLAPSTSIKSSIHFLPPKTLAKAWGWAWPFVTVSSRTAKAASRFAPSPANSVSLRSLFPIRDEMRLTRDHGTLIKSLQYGQILINYNREADGKM